MPGEFDAIFCNSAFQWFTDEPRALANCFAALRPGGRMAMQAPARHDYCPQFVRAVATLAADPRTSETWARFQHAVDVLRDRATSTAGCSPTRASPLVAAEIEELREHATPERALDMFESGAAAGLPEPGLLRRAGSPRATPTRRESSSCATSRAQVSAGRPHRAALLPRVRARAEAVTGVDRRPGS